jgi:DNA-binding CsgD family transcriptional regulator/pimeloyl-ACP methyl ester carboxylesterase
MAAVMPQVERVVLPDGVKLAHHVIGDGPWVLMLFPYHVNHLEFTWATPLHRQAIIRLAEACRVVNVDLRGTGLSDRDVRDVSIERLADDVVALLDCLGIASVGLCAMGNATLVACRVAASHPRRVNRVVLVGAGSSAVDGRLFELHELSPDLQFEARASLVAGLGDPLNAAALAATMKNAVAADTFSRYLQGVRSTDLSALLGDVSVPVMVVNATDDHLIPLASAQRLAHGLQHVRVFAVEGDSSMAPWRDRGAVDEMIRFLVGTAPEALPGSGSHSKRRRATAVELTRREGEVLRLVAEGRTNQQIADALHVSPNTVSHHLRGIFAKTGSHNRSQAAGFAHRNGLT